MQHLYPAILAPVKKEILRSLYTSIDESLEEDTEKDLEQFLKADATAIIEKHINILRKYLQDKLQGTPRQKQKKCNTLLRKARGYLQERVERKYLSNQSKTMTTTRGTNVEEDDTDGLQSIRDEYWDRMDGGLYLGYMSREYGKFGSLPMYDDYGDESVP